MLNEEEKKQRGSCKNRHVCFRLIMVKLRKDFPELFVNYTSKKTPPFLCGILKLLFTEKRKVVKKNAVLKIVRQGFY